MHKALSEISKSLQNNKEQITEYRKSIKANQKVLDNHFDKVHELEMVQKRLVGINIDLNTKYDAEPEEQEEKTTSVTKSFQNLRKNQGISM